MSLEQIITKYFEYLQVERALARASLLNYKHHLKIIMAFFGNDYYPINMDVAAVSSFRKHLSGLTTASEGTPLGIRTQNLYLITLRGLIRFMQRSKIDVGIGYEEVELLSEKGVQPRVRVLSKEQLIELIDIPVKTNVDLRNKAALELLFSTGMRIAELTSLKLTDFDPHKASFSIRGKGGKLRMVFISERAKKVLLKYLKTIPFEQELLFPVTIRHMQHIIANRADFIGIPFPVSPHVIRHTFATNLLENGANMRVIQELLGHSSITTTQRYAHVSSKLLEQTFKEFHGFKQTKPSTGDESK